MSRDIAFHRKWLGLAQPVEGLVFSLPVLVDAQIAPRERRDLSVRFEEQLEGNGERINSLEAFFRDFLGYDRPGMLVPGEELPEELSFYAAEGGQEIRPTFAIARGPFDTENEDPFALFNEPVEKPQPGKQDGSPWIALLWDLTESAEDLDLDAQESRTGAWRYPPTAKFERLLRHVGVPIGFLFNGKELRLVYAPEAEATSHLTFRVPHLRGNEGRTLLTALELLLHADRTYGAAQEFSLEGLLAESRRRQADITAELAEQVFEAVEILIAGFERAAERDGGSERLDWLRPALQAGDDHFYQGVLSVVLRLVFTLYAEDQGLLPVEHPFYARHLSLGELYEELGQDAGAHPESMGHRFGAYGRLLALFRTIFFGARHGDFELPSRRGKLFDPAAFPFLEGGLPGQAASEEAGDRAAAQPPSVDDGTIYRVLHRLLVFQGQRLSYRSLDVEQIGSVYESLMGYEVLRTESPAVRLGPHGVWVEVEAFLALSKADRTRMLRTTCALPKKDVETVEEALAQGSRDALLFLEVLTSLRRTRGAEKHRVEAGRLVLQPGEERRRTGSHYTPRSLTEPIVARTLEPLLACLGEAPTVEQLLQLKICDPAMGSGAFLVAACRALASEVVAAWTRAGELASVVERHGDPHLHARRLVAQRCLYGVDRNAAAVELAKLSLWLVTLSRELPFTFVDHALRHGDSLMGLDFQQIEAFHWKPSGQVENAQLLLREALSEAVALRQEILALADREDPQTQAEKRQLFVASQDAIEKVRVLADLCVGAFFAEEKGRARELERNRRLDLVEEWLDGERTARDESRSEEEREETREKARLAYAELLPLAQEAREAFVPFHWWIEFPEVFFEKRPDPLDGGKETGGALMEAVVGNPPFLGGSSISGRLGPGLRDWLLEIHTGAHGNADLSAHFFRRASRLLGTHGTFGLIATNTIAQGDTRTTGLAPLVRKGWQIYDATSSMPWPGNAAVTVSVVHGARGNPTGNLTFILDAREMKAINSRLRPMPEREDPVRLSANRELSFLGAKIYGQGFILTPEERDELVAKDPRNAERIFPYLGGDEVNSNPTHDFHRHVINFGEMSREEAGQWPDLLGIVLEKVKPERDRNNRENYRKYWWRFGENRPGLNAALAPLESCLVTSRNPKHLCISFQPTDRILSEQLIIFPLVTHSAFAVLQSRIHECWARLHSSSMKQDLRYTPSDCFETFPFPGKSPRAEIPELEAIGEKLYEARARYLVDTNQGLTQAYNALKDPKVDDERVLALRRLHEELDRAVLVAYGWDDLEVPPFCPTSEAEEEAIQAFADEVIDRLYVLNEERAREEAIVAAAQKRRKTARAAPKKDARQGGLFE